MKTKTKMAASKHGAFHVIVTDAAHLAKSGNPTIVKRLEEQNAMVRSVPHAVSAGMAKENAILAGGVEIPSVEALRELYSSAERYVEPFTITAEGRQFAAAVAVLKPGSLVVDIGAGQGRQSLALALMGFRVVSVEPCFRLCEWIEQLAAAFQLSIEAICCSGEGLAAVHDLHADACLFSASLHHCDDPTLALRAAGHVLKPGGRLLVLNEPHLPRFRSKQWFARTMERHESPAGDYGGNEHTYYWHEYRAMIQRAGFVELDDALSLRYQDPTSYQKIMFDAGAPTGARSRRSAYYRLIRQIDRLGSIGKPVLTAMKHLSLLHVNYSAKKAA